MDEGIRQGNSAWLGRIGYSECYKLQKRIHLTRCEGNIPDTLLLLEHPPVITLGRGFHPDNLLLLPKDYQEKGIEVAETDRGGDVTYHGPGQLVGYPIFDLNQHGRDLHKFLRDIEEAIILALAEFKIDARRFPPHTGVWVEDKKVCAIGIRVSRWVSMHGFALNVENDNFGFDTIIPCGISSYGVTSISKLMGAKVTLEQIKQPVISAFEHVFKLNFEEIVIDG